MIMIIITIHTQYAKVELKKKLKSYSSYHILIINIKYRPLKVTLYNIPYYYYCIMHNITL